MNAQRPRKTPCSCSCFSWCWRVGGLEILFLLKRLNLFFFWYTHQHLVSHPPLNRKFTVPAVRNTVSSVIFAQGQLDSFTGLGRHYTDWLLWIIRCCWITTINCMVVNYLMIAHVFIFHLFLPLSYKWDFLHLWNV